MGGGGAAQTASAGEKVGFIGGITLSAAMDLEVAAGERYRKLAESASSALASVLKDLAGEEDSHLVHLREFNEKDHEDAVWRSGEAPDMAGAKASVRSSPGDQVMVRSLIEHEESTALFYRSLAGKTAFPSVRGVLAHLAEEEEGHAKCLREFV